MRISSEKDIQKGLRFLVKNCEILSATSKIAEQVPLRLSTANFAGIASIIVSQQVSKASADAIFSRLKERINPLNAETFLRSSETDWKIIGLSRPKQRTLIALSRSVEDGNLNLSGLCELPPNEAINSMTNIKGIGPWTAEVYLLFCAGHADIFPAGDLALQEAVKIAFNLKDRPNEKQTKLIAEKWSPWRGVAARLLWDYYRVIKKGRDASPVQF